MPLHECWYRAFRLVEMLSSSGPLMSLLTDTLPFFHLFIFIFIFIFGFSVDGFCFHFHQKTKIPPISACSSGLNNESPPFIFFLVVYYHVLALPWTYPSTHLRVVDTFLALEGFEPT
jgi:hypothetical protein